MTVLFAEFKEIFDKLSENVTLINGSNPSQDLIQTNLDRISAIIHQFEPSRFPDSKPTPKTMQLAIIRQFLEFIGHSHFEHLGRKYLSDYKTQGNSEKPRDQEIYIESRLNELAQFVSYVNLHDKSFSALPEPGKIKILESAQYVAKSVREMVRTMLGNIDLLPTLQPYITHYCENHQNDVPKNQALVIGETIESAILLANENWQRMKAFTDANHEKPSPQAMRELKIEFSKAIKAKAPKDVQQNAIFTEVYRYVYNHALGAEVTPANDDKKRNRKSLRLKKQKSAHFEAPFPSAPPLDEEEDIAALHAAGLEDYYNPPLPPMAHTGGWRLFAKGHPDLLSKKAANADRYDLNPNDHYADALKTKNVFRQPVLTLEYKTYDLTEAERKKLTVKLEEIRTHGLTQTCPKSGLPFYVNVQENPHGYSITSQVFLNDIKPIDEDNEPGQHYKRYCDLMYSLLQPTLAYSTELTIFGGKGKLTEQQRFYSDLGVQVMHSIALYLRDDCKLNIASITVEDTVDPHSEAYKVAADYMTDFKRRYPPNVIALQGFFQLGQKIRQGEDSPLRTSDRVRPSAPGTNTLRGMTNHLKRSDSEFSDVFKPPLVSDENSRPTNGPFSHL
jgi:hypothetical protein